MFHEGEALYGALLLNKPYKRGFKFFVLSGSFGYAYIIKLNTRKENVERKGLVSGPNLGATANLVVG